MIDFGDGTNRKMHVQTLLNNKSNDAGEETLTQKHSQQALQTQPDKIGSSKPSHDVSVLVNNINIKINNQNEEDEEEGQASHMNQDPQTVKMMNTSGNGSTMTKYGGASPPNQDRVETDHSLAGRSNKPKQFEPVLGGNRRSYRY